MPTIMPLRFLSFSLEAIELKEELYTSALCKVCRAVSIAQLPQSHGCKALHEGCLTIQSMRTNKKSKIVFIRKTAKKKKASVKLPWIYVVPIVWSQVLFNFHGAARGMMALLLEKPLSHRLCCPTLYKVCMERYIL